MACMVRVCIKSPTSDSKVAMLITEVRVSFSSWSRHDIDFLSLYINHHCYPISQREFFPSSLYWVLLVLKRDLNLLVGSYVKF